MEFLFNCHQPDRRRLHHRLIHRSALRQIQPYFTIGGSSFGPEMMLLTLSRDRK
jgi:hypothetical protein